jgi:hypothetical protein
MPMEQYFVCKLLLPIICNDFYTQNMSHNTNQEAKMPPTLIFIFSLVFN